jgi:hypothetical protein
VLRRSELRRGARILRAGPIVIDVRSREVRVFDRPVELSDKEYQLLVRLAAEPTRMFTKIDFELPPAPGRQREQGIQELGAEFVSPSPGEPLATCLPRAVSRGLGACRRPTGRTWQPARRRTLARASALRALRQQAARHVVSSSITAMSDVSPDGARSIRPTSPCSVAAVISWSTDAATGARRRPHVRCPVSTDAAVCVTHFSPCGAAAFRGPSRATDFT